MVNYDGVSRTFNDANQMTNDGTNTLTYDNNGNLTGNGLDTYIWDRANRLLSVGNHIYVYDGLGNRVQQTVSSVVTDYLNDVQPALTKLLKQTTGANVEQFVHAPRGIHAVDDGTDWNFFLQDGLGSVRGLVDDIVVVQETHKYGPYGNYIGTTPTDAYFGYTGEYTDKNKQLYLRARYYDPSSGIFVALDTNQGDRTNTMSLNRYSYVHGNPINLVDKSGKQATHTESGCLVRNIGLIRRLLRIGRFGSDVNFPITQSSCGNTSGAHPPFGCNNGQPIDYALVRGFAQGDYSIAERACPSWQGTEFPEHHCGLDFVSYSDGGLSWNTFDDRGDRKLRIKDTQTGDVHIYNIDTGLKETGENPECLSPDQFESGQYQAQFIGPADGMSGRKVYALFDGEVKGWSQADATLSIKLADGSKDTSLELQYTHLTSCDGANPAALGGNVTKGQHIGCYANVGATDTPHLHIGFVQRDTDGGRLTATEINDRLCHPEDIYLNPAVANTNYGFGNFVVGSGLSTLPSHLRYGYSSVPIAGTDWEDTLP